MYIMNGAIVKVVMKEGELMALLSYIISGVIGYNLIFMAILVVAILIGNNAGGWIVYVAGAIIQFLSLCGNSRFGINSIMLINWVVYFVLLIIARVIIEKRWKNR